MKKAAEIDLTEEEEEALDRAWDKMAEQAQKHPDEEDDSQP